MATCILTDRRDCFNIQLFYSLPASVRQQEACAMPLKSLRAAQKNGAAVISTHRRLLASGASLGTASALAVVARQIGRAHV